MWCLNKFPNSIKVESFIKDIDKGYQLSEYKIYLDHDNEEEILLNIPFPSVSYKKDGSFKLNKEIYELKNFTQIDNAQLLKMEDITIISKIKEIKKFENIQLVNVQEMISHYIENFYCLSFFIKPKKEYIISFKHKIASNSCLFFPSILPTMLIHNSECNVDYKLWINKNLAIKNDLIKENICEEKDDVSLIKLNKTNIKWEEDLYFNSNSWESSDDLNSSDDNN